MNFTELIKDLPIECHQIGDGKPIKDLVLDSRKVGAGSVFCALKGAHTDGHAYIDAAIKNGAIAILTEHAVAVDPRLGVGVITNLRNYLGTLAKRFYQCPDERLKLIGITGTNGKTTTAYLVHQIISASGDGCGLIGTVHNVIGGQVLSADRTTPEAPDFYRMLHDSVLAKDKFLVTEVSSIGLDMGRVSGVSFTIGAFTNLTQDHLDFHHSMDNYFQSKKKLILQSKKFITNIDDSYGELLLKESNVISIGSKNVGDYQAKNIRLTPVSSVFDFIIGEKCYPIESPLVGEYNVANLLLALALCIEVGIPIQTCLAAIPKLYGAPGRLERVDIGQPFGVLIDYAHTPDALHKMCSNIKKMMAPGHRLHILFGCGGERDAGKRPLMCAAVAQYADVIWHTSDNPRRENPQEILDQGAAGIAQISRGNQDIYHQIVDRGQAVKLAIEDCKVGDLLILAGKGHEEYQEIGTSKIPYNDRRMAEEALRQRYA